MDDFRPINQEIWRGDNVAVQVLSRSCVRKRACAHRESLRLAFHDKREDVLPEAQAAEIAEFVNRHHRNEIRLFVVHCNAGVSRFAAVAAAIWANLEEDPGAFFTEYHPNQGVFAKVSEALRRPQAS